ncbi:MAG: MFS transporter [Chloroflexi bacterium]|nr:MFS transporter [Chloroflexota bacterium]
MFVRLRAIYDEFPGTFWTLMGASFIDRLGGALLFPFFTLYITDHFSVGMTEAGILFSIFSITSVFGSMFGGAMTDKFGRRGMIIFGLVVSALSSLGMGLVNDLYLFYGIAGLVGLLSNAGGPAQQAMVADLLPEEKLSQGYGIWRVLANLAVTIGPAIGGFLASRSYFILFISDAVTSIVMALIVLMILPETKPEKGVDQPEESIAQTFAGYTIVLRDGVFMAFIFVSILTTLVYVQMNSTLAVYLRDVHAISTQGFGYILSLNAGMVVLFQFWISRRTSRRPPLHLMAFGTVFYALGFAMYGFVTSFILFLLAMAVITIGEMIISPVAQALVAQFAPEEMRGRYMAMNGFSWTIPFAVGPLLAGLIMDNANPNWVWYAAGIIGAVAALGYAWLHGMVGERLPDSSSTHLS